MFDSVLLSFNVNTEVTPGLDPLLTREISPQANQHPDAPRNEVRWRWGLLAAVAMALLSLYPQIDLWVTRGAQWNGSFASQSYDEEIYAAYINGLALGRPRLSLPLEIPTPNKPSYESFYSIQLVPAYLVSTFVRASGFTVSEAFILLTPLMAYLSTLVLFNLFVSITRDERFAAVSAVGALVFGTLAARHSVMLDWLGMSGWYGSFLFLRRYTHAVSFPMFLLFIVLIWHLFTLREGRSRIISIAAAVTFVLLIFSYAFMWTAALAWLVCFTAVWLIARPLEWRRVVVLLLPLFLMGASALALYAMFLQRRDPEFDRLQLLEFTRAPDFYRAPIWISVIVIFLLIWAIRRGWAEWRQPAILLTLSFALTPLAVFNQQIVTGRSLQPDHYEMFSANYVALVAVSLIAFTIWKGHQGSPERPLARWVIALLGCAIIGWGLLEIGVITLKNRERNVQRDSFVPVTRRLTQLAIAQGKGAVDREVVFSPDVIVVSENVSALAPQAPLMSMTLPFAAGLSIQEWRERYFQYLYYCGAQPNDLLRALRENEMVSTMSTFGYERYNPNLTNDFRPVTDDEIQEKVREYTRYIGSFNLQHSTYPRISYVVVEKNSDFDFSNLDRWYSRDAGELIGPFALYQVEHRTARASGAP